MKKIELPACPVAIVLELIGNKWKILIIRDLINGTMRFGELKKSVGCSQKVLSANLKELESYKLIKRNAYAEIPPRVEYSLSEVGQSLKPILASMAEWGESYRSTFS